MDSSGRHQRSSMSFSYAGFPESIDQMADESWKLGAAQCPQVVDFYNGFRASHDDLCADPPKCLGNDSCNMAFGRGHPPHIFYHTRHFAPHVQSGHNQLSNAVQFGDPFGNVDMSGLAGSFNTAQPNHFYPTPSYSGYDTGELTPSLSHLSPRQQRPQDDDTSSVCDSDCSPGEICRGEACADDLSACDDENCLQSCAPITSEAAAAAEALASFGGQEPHQLPPSSDLHGHNHNQSNFGHLQAGKFPTPCGTPGSLEPYSDGTVQHPNMNLAPVGQQLYINPEWIMNYQHLREAHNPLQPSCTGTVCPIDDPDFYQECHIRDCSSPQQSLFGNIDLNLMDTSTDGVECGEKLPNRQAMIQHFWNKHLQIPFMSQPVMPSVAKSTPSSMQTMASPSQSTKSSSSASLDPANFMFRSGSPSALPCGVETRSTYNSPADAMQYQTATSSTADATHHSEDMHRCEWCDVPGSSSCAQVFPTAANLHKHVLSTHTYSLKRDLGGAYSCGWAGCPRRSGQDKGGFAQKSKIERHMQVHTGNKPFVCEICNERFSANQALLQHQLIHEDSKPLSCETCGKKFRQQSALTMHIRTHTKERPLKCNICGKEFSESSNLSKHKRIHNDKGTYLCSHPGCTQRFHRKDQLRRHSAKHRKVAESPALSAQVKAERDSLL